MKNSMSETSDKSHMSATSGSKSSAASNASVKKGGCGCGCRSARADESDIIDVEEDDFIY